MNTCTLATSTLNSTEYSPIAIPAVNGAPDSLQLQLRKKGSGVEEIIIITYKYNAAS